MCIVVFRLKFECDDLSLTSLIITKELLLNILLQPERSIELTNSTILSGVYICHYYIRDKIFVIYLP